ncbi:DMT family transporter [Glutamicibacter sp. JC586]|uniref:DMT family transporter n=1 Tax=Glutamicibacter sp. JC586 TaxID=2590552 RepID=UPI00190F2223|nr:EamA family transporter [Glutamicibacter sp. JC586]
MLTLLGPIGFGSTYWVTHQFLPAGSPLWGSAFRALPAGLALMVIVRRLPQGSQWSKSIVLGTINMGLFFLLAFMAAQLLPSSIAASFGAASPLVLAAFAWFILKEKTRMGLLLTAVLGILGVVLVVGATTEKLAWTGIAASFGMLVLMALGATLNRKWNDGTPVLTSTAWQLMVGGFELLIVAIALEGTPPQVDVQGVLAVVYLSLFATAFAYFCWFSGFKHLPATTVGIIGLVNPVTGVALGVVLGGESFTGTQFVGIVIVVLSVLMAQLLTRGARNVPISELKIESMTDAAVPVPRK